MAFSLNSLIFVSSIAHWHTGIPGRNASPPCMSDTAATEVVMSNGVTDAMDDGNHGNVHQVMDNGEEYVKEGDEEPGEVGERGG